jgi:trehalose-phosphatase
MRTLDPRLDLEAFFMRVARAPERVLLLDYDGTLAPFHADPRLALPYPRACAVLREVAAGARTRIVIVSGRALEDLRAPLAMLPHAEVWASHGWEHAAAGRVSRRIPSIELREELAQGEAAARAAAREGARIERKIASVAVHWRGLSANAAGRVREKMREAWAPHAEGELSLLPFDGGLELRARARNKGDAVTDVLARSAPGTACAYLGDDLTDEDAFRAIRDKGLAVLVREKHRSTAAELWLSHPRELTAFFERWHLHAALA